MTRRRLFRTNPVWIAITIVSFIIAISVHIWVQLIGGYGAGSNWDMLTHFLFGIAISAFFLNFNLSRTHRKLVTILPPVILVVIPAIVYTVAIGLAWELVEEFIQHFLPWVGIYADFWWNGVRDLIMDFLGAVLAASAFLLLFPALTSPEEHKPKPPAISRSPPIPGQAAMNYCDNCGSVVPPDSKHCPRCGHHV